VASGWFKRLLSADATRRAPEPRKPTAKPRERTRPSRPEPTEIDQLLAELADGNVGTMDSHTQNQWWEKADELVEFGGRAIVASDPKEAEFIERVNARLQRGDYQLPVLPAKLIQVIELGNKPDPDVQAITECIRTDAVVAGEVLSLVNSAAFAAASPIRDLQRAVVHVGPRRIRNLMIAVAARLTVFRSSDMARAQRLWMHSLAAAILARAIARAASANTEEAFLAGLLHDVGKSVILGLATEEERAMPEVRVDDAVLDRLCDETHTGVGARIGQEWKLATNLVEAIEQHHGLRPFSPPLVGVTALANDVCGFLGLGCPRRRVDLGRHTAFGILGLDRDRAGRLLQLMPGVLNDAPEFKGLIRF
jgi:putative nucleotidyltransferase with HDIG domain